MAPSEQPVSVLFVGTDHLIAWDGVTGPDIFAEERQQQLDDLVDALAAFEPNRVMVEALPSRQAWLHGSVDDVRSPEFSWTSIDRDRTEVVQIGVRLAARCRADIHGVDADSQLDWSGIEALTAADPATEISALSDDALDLIADHVADRDSSTLLELVRTWKTEPLRSLNDREYLDRYLSIGIDDSAAGVDFVASWWRRNLRIFANIGAASEPGERVVVVFGSGHIPTLEVFTELSGRFNLVALDDVI